MDVNQIFGKDAVDLNLTLRGKRRFTKQGSTSTTQKKSRQDRNEENTQTQSNANALESLDDSDFLELAKDTDTMIVLRSLREESMKISRPPAILGSHTFYFLRNKSMVEKEIHDLVQNGKIRKFYAPTGINEFCYVFTDDYMKYLRSLRGASAEAEVDALDRFEENVLSNCFDVSISKEHLIDLLYGVKGASRITCGEHEIDFFISSGLLALKDSFSFWFVVPNGGKFFGNVSRARDELIGWLKSAPYKEIPLKEILEKKFKRTKLIPVQFAVNDLLGLERIQQVDIGIGILLKYTTS